MGKKAQQRRAARAEPQVQHQPFRFAPKRAPMEAGTLPGVLEDLAIHRDVELLQQYAANEQTFAVPINNKKLDLVFGMVEGILTTMEETGETETLPNGTAIFYNPRENAYFPIADSLYSMADTFDMLAETHGWPAQPPGLRQLAKKFEFGMIMAQHDTDAARKTIAWMRECMLSITPYQFTEASMVISRREELVLQHTAQRRRELQQA